MLATIGGTRSGILPDIPDLGDIRIRREMLARRRFWQGAWQEARPVPVGGAETTWSLSSRQRLVLKAIVHSYVTTAEPVGSRAVARRYRLGISPATIRNVMMDLEELGLIGQPHASAGRVPTDRGYRLYVDGIMRPEGLSRDELSAIDAVYDQASDETHELLERASSVLSALSALLAVTFGWSPPVERVSRVDVVPLDPRRWLLVFNGSGGSVKTSLVLLEGDEPREGWERAVSFLNDALVGCRLDETARGGVRDRLLHAGLGQDRVCVAAVNALDKVVGSAEPEQIHFGGTSNIMSQPEFRDAGKLRGLFQALEERLPLFQLVASDNPSEPGRVQVSIGAEIPNETMQSFSVVSSSYRGRNCAGHISVIGPTRMRYPRLVSLVSYMAAAVSERLDRA